MTRLRLFAALLILAALAGPAGRSAAENDIADAIANWSAPPFWAPARVPSARRAQTPASPALPFFAIAPCRLADTRGNGFTGAYGPPFMPGGTSRDFPIAGQCGIPATAVAVSFNFTVTDTAGPGFLLVFPEGGAQPGVSTLNYVAGQTVANAAVVTLGTGDITAIPGVSGFDLVIDVNGYYAPTGIVDSVNGLVGDVQILPGADIDVTTAAPNVTVSVLSSTTSTPNSLVKRDGSGNFTATGFSGALLGDVTGLQTATSVSALHGVPLSLTPPSAAGQTLTYDGAQWAPASPSGWSLTGNAGTSAGTNFLGTRDAQPLLVKTGGAAAANERARFLTTPQVLVNATAPQAGDLFAVYGSGYAGATTSAANQTDYPVNGYSTGAFAGIYGENTGTGQGLLGVNSATGVGVYGQNTTSGVGVFGTTATGAGVFGTANGALAAGVRGGNQNASGTGVVALGNNIAAATLISGGSGLAANGTLFGVYAVGTSVPSGVGVLAGGGNVVTPLSLGGEGIAGSGVSLGISGWATGPLADNRWAGYFDFHASANGYAYVAGRSGGVDYAILSTGTKSTIVEGLAAGEQRIMFCPEAPEVLFEDYGTGALSSGIAHVDLDPTFAKNVLVDGAHPLKVFVQVEGDCNGVYVTSKSATHFDVRELRGGTSSVGFSYHVVATRADSVDAASGTRSAFSAARFPLAPARLRPAKDESLRAVAAPPADAAGLAVGRAARADAK